MTALECCPDDLFARARGGSISVRDQEQLDRHIAGCSDCRALLLLSRGFDQRMPAQPGDTQVLARMVDRVRAARDPVAMVASTEVVMGGGQQGHTPLRRSRLGALIFAAALTAGVATAAGLPATRRFFRQAVASVATLRAPAPARVAKPTPADRAPSAASAQPAVMGQPSAPVDVAPIANAAAPSPAPEVNDRRPATQSNAKARTPEAPTAERLFAEANARRKAGDTSGARRLYGELARRYPGSPEAQVSSASLGRLLLERSDDAAGALEQFDRLLARPAASMAQPALAEEALFGRATALMRLGRASDEKAAWAELLARFPGSVYSERARDRLRALK